MESKMDWKIRLIMLFKLNPYALYKDYVQQLILSKNITLLIVLIANKEIFTMVIIMVIMKHTIVLDIKEAFKSFQHII